ncbi:aspartate carbamoyltransferase [Candidatus Saccharibacteria bacterium]|nr:aspartate carbamoyltransferase [Candidatus Saccharibacteria bacterium]
MQHVISIKQFSDTKKLDGIFSLAAEFQNTEPHRYPQSLQNKIVANLFYEPSTRTRFSFETAALNLGGRVISTENGSEYSSTKKGESLEDTIRTINQYADVIVMRHPMVGSAKLAADHSRVPIINAGDGGGEHPTQGLLDLFTIRQAKGKIDGLKVVAVGDTLHSRTIHSLIDMLKLYNTELYLVAPKELQMSKQELEPYLGRSKITQLDSYDDVLNGADVMYVNRVQEERFADRAEFERLRSSFCVTNDTLKRMKDDAVIMNPLPRVNEIHPEVDNDPRAIYFEQARNGVYIRMALLDMLMTPEVPSKLRVSGLQTA